MVQSPLIVKLFNAYNPVFASAGSNYIRFREIEILWGAVPAIKKQNSGKLHLLVSICKSDACRGFYANTVKLGNKLSAFVVPGIICLLAVSLGGMYQQISRYRFHNAATPLYKSPVGASSFAASLHSAVGDAAEPSTAEPQE